MKRSHRIIFTLIAMLAVATFLFGLLQFLTMPREPTPPAARSNSVAGPGP